ncbi:succinate--CoA ligase subunit alpha [Candidatus Daviesbacteria bacterium RIFCSPHIGHO2_02_FULL_39_8]|nr:MAG: succinate--CoA ligase subunit alpha [Candidatus Daviesbacteria bacterium RIFCSPHIGHO2_02_FULL_39_8]
MAILVTEKTKILVQGITGKEGSKVALQMQNYGTKVLAGVTPGKGGQEVHGVPVYNTVAEALENHPGINTSFVAVPNFTAFGAIKEAVEAQIALINILTEHIPIQDTAKAIALAKEAGVRIVGPSSIGIISPGIGKVGSIGGDDPRGVFRKGSVGVISKSGGMASEVSWILTQTGMGQSTVIGIGGDILEGSSFVDLLEEFEKDPQTESVVIFGEIGGTYEEEAAEFIKSGNPSTRSARSGPRFTKPVVAFISGLFAETLPQGTKLGHAGAIVYGEKGSYKSKIKALEEAGVKIAKTPDEIPELLKNT